jgi:predicted O-methyltransferase YrrM
VIDISHALTVEGWMGELELSYLADLASRSSNVAEVGSWMGRSTSALAANVGSGLVVAVDTWRGSAEHAVTLAARSDGWLLSEFRRNTKGLPVMPVPLPSLDAAFLLAKTTMRFDLIFVDANHSYEAVKADILAWTPLLADGGILCGHDYDPPNWMGVKQAVDECVPRFRVVPNTTIWTTEGAQ